MAPERLTVKFKVKPKENKMRQKHVGSRKVTLKFNNWFLRCCLVLSCFVLSCFVLLEITLAGNYLFQNYI